MAQTPINAQLDLNSGDSVALLKSVNKQPIIAASSDFAGLLDKVLLDAGFYDKDGSYAYTDKKDNSNDAKLKQDKSKDNVDKKGNEPVFNHAGINQQNFSLQNVPLTQPIEHTPDTSLNLKNTEGRKGEEINLDIINKPLLDKKPNFEPLEGKEEPILIKIEKLPELITLEKVEPHKIANPISEKAERLTKTVDKERVPDRYDTKEELYEPKQKTFQDQNITEREVEKVSLKTLQQEGITEKGDHSETSKGNPKVTQESLSKNFKTNSDISPLRGVDALKVNLPPNGQNTSNNEFSQSFQDKQELGIQALGAFSAHESKAGAFKKILNQESHKSSQLLTQTVQGIKKMTEEQKSHLNIQLYPQEWGSINIRINMQGSQVNAIFMAQNPETLKALANQRTELEKILSNYDFRINPTSVRFVLDPADSNKGFNPMKNGSVTIDPIEQYC